MPVSAGADVPDQVERALAARRLHSMPFPPLANIEACKRLCSTGLSDEFTQQP
jgi:hypothetical protein